MYDVLSATPFLPSCAPYPRGSGPPIRVLLGISPNPRSSSGRRSHFRNRFSWPCCLDKVLARRLRNTHTHDVPCYITPYNPHGPRPPGWGGWIASSGRCCLAPSRVTAKAVVRVRYPPLPPEWESAGSSSPFSGSRVFRFSRFTLCSPFLPVAPWALSLPRLSSPQPLTFCHFGAGFQPRPGRVPVDLSGHQSWSAHLPLSDNSTSLPIGEAVAARGTFTTARHPSPCLSVRESLS